MVPAWRSGRPHRIRRAFRVHPLVWVCHGASDVSSAEAYRRVLDGRRVVVGTDSQASLLLRALGCPADEVEAALGAAGREPAHYGLPDDDRVWDAAAEAALMAELGRSMPTGPDPAPPVV